MKNVSSWLGYGERARAVVEHVCGHMDEEEKVVELARQNVLAQLDNLRTHPSVAARMAGRTLNIHGWLLELHTGTVEAWSEEAGQFIPLENTYQTVGSH
jgi:carbonic anhydrase